MNIIVFISSIAKYISSISFRYNRRENPLNSSYLPRFIEIHPSRLNSFVHINFLMNETTMRAGALSDLWAVDYPKRYRGFRFQVNYLFWSHYYNVRIRQYLFTDHLQPIPSMTAFFPSANWLEREVWNMFGVLFINHPDLRNILTDYGFEGKPLRKDFPLVGYSQIRYDEEQKRVIYEPVNLNQDFRAFSFLYRKEVK